MSDFYIGQIFDNEYPTKAATFANTNNCRIEHLDEVERTVDRIDSRPGVGTGSFVVFTDGTEKSIVPIELKKFVKGTKHMMPRLQIVKKADPTLDELKTAKLAEIENGFLSWYGSGAVLTSSFGFVADSDQRAKMDVDGLVTRLESLPEESRSTVLFRGKDNKFYPLTFEQVKTLQLEIIDNGNYAYQQKWDMESSVSEATNKSELDAIEIKFVGKDFSETTK